MGAEVSLVNTQDLQVLIDKLKGLSSQRLTEVEDFVDFLRTREEEARSAAADRLGKAMAKLAAVQLPRMSEDEVQAEIDASRRERLERSSARRR
jgi:CHASE3 domain sensor protein